MDLLALMVAVVFAGVPTRVPPDPEKGESLYRDNCWQCHGAQGLGDGPVSKALHTPPPPLAGRWTEDRFDAAVEVIRQGRGDMPGFSAIMDKHDARRVMVWLATLDARTGLSRNPTPERADDEDQAGGDEWAPVKKRKPDPLSEGDAEAGDGPGPGDDGN